LKAAGGGGAGTNDEAKKRAKNFGIDLDKLL